MSEMLTDPYAIQIDQQSEVHWETESLGPELAVSQRSPYSGPQLLWLQRAELSSRGSQVGCLMGCQPECENEMLVGDPFQLDGSLHPPSV